MSSVDFYRRVPKDLTEVRRNTAGCNLHGGHHECVDHCVASSGTRGFPYIFYDLHFAHKLQYRIYWQCQKETHSNVTFLSFLTL